MDNNEILRQLAESERHRREALISIKTLYNCGVIKQDLYDSLLENIDGIIGNIGDERLVELAFKNHQYVFNCKDNEGKELKILIKTSYEEIK